MYHLRLYTRLYTCSIGSDTPVARSSSRRKTPSLRVPRPPPIINAIIIALQKGNVAARHVATLIARNHRGRPDDRINFATTLRLGGKKAAKRNLASSSQRCRLRAKRTRTPLRRRDKERSRDDRCPRHWLLIGRLIDAINLYSRVACDEIQLLLVR